MWQPIRNLPWKWWDERSARFDLVISEMVHREASEGDAEAATLRVQVLDGLRILKLSEEALVLAESLVSHGPIPRPYIEDALHIAIAAVNGIDYLLTWNCKHLANAAHRTMIELIVEEAGYRCPVICTPEELMED